MTNETRGWEFVVELMHIYRDVMQINERATGMSKTRLEIMHELTHVEELSQADLQKHLGVEGAVVTRIVKQLEAKGLVTRRADPRDNRYTLVALTPEARSLNTTTDALKFKDSFGEELMEGLSQADRAKLMRLMRKVGENAKAIREAAKHEGG